MTPVYEKGFKYWTELNYYENDLIGVETEQGASFSTLERRHNRKFSLLNADVYGGKYTLWKMGLPEDRPDYEGPYGYLNQYDTWDDATKAQYAWWTQEVAELQYSISGYQGSTLVNSIVFGALDGVTADFKTLTFGDTWKNLTKVQFEIHRPSGWYCDEDYCGNLQINRMEVASVPLPASGLLLLGGMAGITALKGRFRSLAKLRRSASLACTTPGRSPLSAATANRSYRSRP